MVCCTLIAALLGLFAAPLLFRRTSPLAWRPEAPTPFVPRAAGRLQSFAHAFAGLGFLLRNEPNMRIHLVAAAAVVLAGIGLRITTADWRWLALAIALVFITEALNTAVEQACNAITRRPDPAIKAAKDVAAGAVLLASLAAIAIGLGVFLPHIATAFMPPQAGQASFLCLGGR